MRGFRRVMIVLVVLVALLVAVDRAGAWAAGRAVSDQVEEELASYEVDSAPPEAGFGGFPFLTQVAAGEYQEVTLRLRDVGSSGLRLPLVELTATGVTAPASTIIEGEGAIDAERVVGTATIGYASVAALSGQEGLTLASSGGDLSVRLPVELLGESVTLVGSADVSVEGQSIQVRVTELTVEEGSGLPPGAEPAVDQIAQSLSVDVTLPPLPYGLTVESVRPAQSGLAVTLSARNVPLSR